MNVLSLSKHIHANYKTLKKIWEKILRYWALAMNKNIPMEYEKIIAYWNASLLVQSKLFAYLTSRQEAKCALTGWIHCCFSALMGMFKRKKFNQSLFWQINTLMNYIPGICSCTSYGHTRLCLYYADYINLPFL